MFGSATDDFRPCCEPCPRRTVAGQDRGRHGRGRPRAPSTTSSDDVRPGHDRPDRHSSAKLALGDLRGAAAYSRDLTNLMRIRGSDRRDGVVRSRRVRRRTRPDRPGRVLLRARRRGAGALRKGTLWLPWRSGLARVIAGRGEIAPATALVEAGARRRARPRPAVRRRLRAAHTGRDRADRRPRRPARRGARGARRARRSAARRADPYRPRRLAPAAPVRRSRPGPSTSCGVPRSTRARRSSPHCWRRIRWLLERLGEAPDGELPGRLAELSAAERRVAQLVVVGKRNREIAASWASA